ncbi:uncharacterized protein LOC124164498 [Ischnura elegans]|uniref:uncharacterized protein LOC124164498 n=1 Tax=Ischnura elegans TaxID=197161 RepID=UPI001ED8AE28|nr:uncharacterized protein LOC124164498 [Ischnura elegans]
MIVTGVEAAIRGLPKNFADEIREDVSRILRKTRPPKPNTTAAERKALQELKNNEDLLIIPADKGNATVIMKRSDYNDKITTLLSSATYKELKSDPTAKLERSTRSIIKTSSIPAEVQRKLLPSASKPPRLYGLPKVHKEGIPLRPIVSNIGAPTYLLAQYLAEALQPFTGNSSSFVKNSTHFIERLQETTVKNGDLLVSFDIVSLFTNVPINDSIKIVEKLIDNGLPKDFPRLVEHCLRNSFFLWNDRYYEQSDGAAMGSPLSPVIANLFMEEFEN